MKKEYIAPVIEEQSMEAEEMFATSGVSSDSGITYGGVDDTGSLDPEAREIFSALFGAD